MLTTVEDEDEGTVLDVAPPLPEPDPDVLVWPPVLPPDPDVDPPA